MVILYIPNIEIPTDLGWTHDATDWQLSTTPVFKDDDIVKKSMSDTDNLTSITMDVDLPANTLLYARARVICNKGIFEWSNIGVIKIEDFVKVTFEQPIPSKVMKPVIHLDFDKENFPSTMFTITTDEMSSSSNSDLIETTYFITDIHGTPYYFNTTKDDLTKKLVNEIVLPEDKVYIISASFKSSSKDVSSVATEVVYVKPIKDINLKTSTSDIDTNNDFAISIDTVTNFKSMEVTIYGAGMDIKKEIYTTSQESLSIVVPSTAFEGFDISSILIGIEVTYQDDSKSGFKYYPATIIRNTKE